MGKKKPLGDNPLSQQEPVHDDIVIRDMIRGKKPQRTPKKVVVPFAETAQKSAAPDANIPPVEEQEKAPSVLRRTFSFISRKLRKAG